MKTIYKFYLRIGEQTLPIGGTTQILSVQARGAHIALWAGVDLAMPTEYRRIGVYMTGAMIPRDVGIFIGTVHLSNGIDCHCFDLPL